MDIEYVRTARKSYMVIKNADFTFENYELQMVLRNEIACLLPFQIIMEDGVVAYWYDVTGMQSLERQFAFSQVKEEQLRRLLENLMEMKYAMEEYLLDDRNLCLSSNMIFYDRFSDRLRFCYIPGFGSECYDGEKELFEELLQHLDHTDPMAVSIGYDIYERCVRSEVTMEDYRECLRLHLKEKTYEPQNENRKEDPERNYPRTPVQGSGKRLTKPAESFQDTGLLEPEDSGHTVLDELEYLKSDAGKESHKRKRKRSKRRKTVDYSQILEREQDMALMAENLHQPSYTECFSEDTLRDLWELIYKGDGLEMDFQLEQFPYLVGTDAEKSQGILQARTVSRVHAGLTMNSDKLYLEDFNSTNGTYLNHRMIPMNTPVELHPGDRIVFATEEYMVYCRKVPK